ncbi:unnamed protein product [Effrenium voratum]|nr:unnamed protein product [Effrenium voratum]CAJ1460107.1 unnamed protein product [Effrenium voratum]
MAAVKLNVYHLRPVLSRDERKYQALVDPVPQWLRLWAKDAVGVYHVGVEVYGIEFCYGVYSMKNGYMVGGPENGIIAHEPRISGRGCLWRSEVPLGTTSCSPEQVVAMARALGGNRFGRQDYDRLENNCVDFAGEFLRQLGAEEMPHWCQRGLRWYRSAQALGALWSCCAPQDADAAELRV